MMSPADKLDPRHICKPSRIFIIRLSLLPESGEIMRTKDDYCERVKTWLTAATAGFSPGRTQIKMGETSAQYSASIAGMEGFSRLLWGLFPLLSGGTTTPLWADFLEGIRHGTDPQHHEYWGDLEDNDQRCVEMAVFGLGLALPGSPLWGALTAKEQDHLVRWLRQSATINVPDNNWHFFPVLIQVGLKCVGADYDMMVINQHLDAAEAFYLGNGWYSDGKDKPRDYYIASGFHFYGLLYSHFMQDVDPQRCMRYRQRARQFAQDYIYYFTPSGAAIPFGRSLTYRFVQVAFWSAVAFTGLDVFTPGIIKGLITRHLDDWLTRPFIMRDGLFSIGYHYPNLVMAEDYNSPGSPYWALKAMLILALPDNSEFWQAECEPLPALASIHCIAEAGQFIIRSDRDNHAFLLMSGQFDRNNFVNFEQKYSKFAYSSHFGFTLERGRYGLRHAACDSMLLFSAGDDYYRGRRECDEVAITPDYLRCDWRPWADVRVTTWLIPAADAHIRLHYISTPRALACCEGGFAVDHHALTDSLSESNGLTLRASSGISQIVDLLNRRQPSTVLTPPGSNILFAPPAMIPCLQTTLNAGSHWLATWVAATPGHLQTTCEAVYFDSEQRQLHVNGRTIEIN